MTNFRRIPFQVLPFAYIKMGGSAIIDYGEDTLNVYKHNGIGAGISNGPSVSCGVLDNYSTPKDYEKGFWDIGLGCMVGLDHCWTPRVGHDKATQATSYVVSPGFWIGGGYDYYSEALQIFSW